MQSVFAVFAVCFVYQQHDIVKRDLLCRTCPTGVKTRPRVLLLILLQYDIQDTFSAALSPGTSGAYGVEFVLIPGIPVLLPVFQPGAT